MFKAIALAAIAAVAAVQSASAETRLSLSDVLPEGNRLSQSLFSGLAPLASLLLGRLLNVNIVGCSICAAISGSSAATTQVVGRMTLKELLASVFGAFIMIRTTLKPDLVPETERALRHVPLGKRFDALKELAPALFLILCALGSMYGCLATPSEAASLGVLGAFIVSLSQGGINLRQLRDVLLGAVQTCSVMGIIILGASILGNVTSTMGLPVAVAEVVTGWDLSPFILILALIALYLVLGTALEGFSMIATTLPVVLPLVEAAGFDKVWFGIFMVLVVEMVQITPPVAFNFAVIQNITGCSTGHIARVAFPFLLIMIGFVILLTVFPQIVHFLPDRLLG